MNDKTAQVFCKVTMVSEDQLERGVKRQNLFCDIDTEEEEDMG